MEFLAELDDYIARRAQDWIEPGACIAIVNCNSLLEYGKTESNTQGGPNTIMTVIQPQITPPSLEKDITIANSNTQPSPTISKVFNTASNLTKDYDILISKRYSDHSILPYFNARLSFLLYLVARTEAMKDVETLVPWSLIALMLNSLSIGVEHHMRIESKNFPRLSNRPFPEDWSLRGLLWTQYLFPRDWFDVSDDDEKLFELPSMVGYRRERILWLGCQLAAFGRCLQYDSTSKMFQATPEFDLDYESHDAEVTTLVDEEDAV